MDALAISPSLVQLVSELATHAAERGWLREAEIIGQAVRLVRPDSAEPIVLHALVRIAGGSYGSAVEFLNLVLEREPFHPRATVFLAFALLKEGRRHDAFTLLKRTVDQATVHDASCVEFAREILRQEFAAG